jgi:two-component system aerobic respiration control protein ArcA
MRQIPVGSARLEVAPVSTMIKALPPPSADKSLRRQIESIKRQRIVNKKVVSLSDFRGLKQEIETRTILVVDDDEIMRSALKRILENENYKVALAVDGLELSKILETMKLDLILLDVNLPWVDGYELCRLLKEHPVLKATPVIFVSARNSKADIQEGFNAGCDDYVTKPFDVDRMSDAIKKILLKSG